MKNDKARYIIIGVIACVLLVALGVVLYWLLDNVFNGALKDFFVSFIIGYNSNLGSYILNDSRLAALFITVTVALSALVSSTGAICAYRAHKRQRALFLRAQDEVTRAQTLAEIETRRKSDLITYLAHDLKTPLASVIAYLSLLDESPELSAEQRAKYTNIALDKAYRLEQLISELFEIIRFNLQTITLNRERINLKLMLEQLADEFYPLLLPNGKRISVSCEDGFVIMGDSDKLARVFNNILKNAAAYSYDDTEIRVIAERAAGDAIIQVINTGDPIPKDKRKLIFEKFYRLDTARSAKTGGAGLGLAIAKQIVEAHGGGISVTSNAERTVFTVTLSIE